MAPLMLQALDLVASKQNRACARCANYAACQRSLNGNQTPKVNLIRPFRASEVQQVGAKHIAAYIVCIAVYFRAVRPNTHLFGLESPNRPRAKQQIADK